MRVSGSCDRHRSSSRLTYRKLILAWRALERMKSSVDARAGSAAAKPPSTRAPPRPQSRRPQDARSTAARRDLAPGGQQQNVIGRSSREAGKRRLASCRGDRIERESRLLRQLAQRCSRIDRGGAGGAAAVPRGGAGLRRAAVFGADLGHRRRYRRRRAEPLASVGQRTGCGPDRDRAGGDRSRCLPTRSFCSRYAWRAYSRSSSRSPAPASSRNSCHPRSSPGCWQRSASS